MKNILMTAILGLLIIGCATVETPQVQMEWDIDNTNAQVVDKASEDLKYCTDFAYKMRIEGSRFTEYSIAMGCMDRRGYKTRPVAKK